MTSPVGPDPRRRFGYRRADGTIVIYRLTRRSSHSPSKVLVRQWAIVKLLACRRRSVHELARRVGVRRVTIQKNPATLVAAGFPLQDAIGRDGKTYVWRVWAAAARAAK